MADAPDPVNMDPKAALAKYDYKGADEDQKAINKVENAIAAHFPASFTAGLAEKSANAPIKEDEVHGKIEKAKADANEKAANDEDAKKELKEDPSAKNPPAGAAVKPEVKAAHASKPPAVEAKKGGAGGAEAKAAGKAGGKDAKGGGHDVGSAPASVTLQAANSGDPDIDGWLDKYPKKSHEPTERISKIKEMSAVAKGFDGQLEKYIDGSGKVDSATATFSSFLGKKEVTAAFGDNPYAKVEGGLGQIMRGISRFANVVSIVGNVCTKIGLVLTVVGLLGMILPPVGAAVSAVARVLNVVGIICDVLGVVLGGILTGLNGVVLAKQIGKGASNEEKAATADMMVSEATSVGGHVMSLAMSYGSGFMKGFKGATKGVVGNLLTKFKGVVGKFAGKALGPVANWAKNIGYKLGIGLEKEAKAGPGLMAKVWKSPGTLLEKARDLKVVKAINNSAAAKGLERFAGKIDQTGWVNKLDGLGEGSGKFVGGKAASGLSSFSTKLKESAEEDAKVIAISVERNAGRDAANRERENIDRDITNNRSVGNSELENRRADGSIAQENVRRSDAAYARADQAEAGRGDAIANAEKDEGKAAKKEYEKGRKDSEKAAETKEKNEEKRKEEFKKDPKKFQNETAAQEGRVKSIDQKLEDPNVSPEEKEKLEHTKAKLEKTLDERKMIPMLASGGEAPETLWQLRGTILEGKEHVTGIKKGFKDEKSETLEKWSKNAEKRSGHAAHEDDEKAERHEKIGEFQAEAYEHSDVTEHVETMLQGLDEELGFEGESGADAGEHHDGGEGALDNLPGNEGGDTTAAASDEQKHEEPGAGPAPAASAEPMNDVKPPEEEKEKAPDPGELAYWPKLTGEFAQAAIELNRMKVVAYQFKKQQAEARKKAYENASIFSKSGEDAEKKADAAKHHTAALGPTIDEAKTSGAKAADGSAQADKGSGEQSKGGGASSTPAAKADPGEKPSMFHPIKRIWWYVKQWASEKAAAVFGWIQNQIASLVLEGLCGVSMGDMKAYTEALRHRMEFSKVSGTQGLDAAKRAMSESDKNKSESKTYEQQALADAADCDQSMADADSFANSVEQTQQELVAEQGKAKAFLENLKTAVAADRQQAAADKAKKAAEAKLASSGAPGGAAAVAAPAPKAAKATEKKQPKPISPAATGKVKNAASYVVTKANGLLQTFVDIKGRQTETLKSALAKQPEFVRGQFTTITVGDSMVAAFRAHTTSVASSLDKVKGASPTTAAELHGHAGQVKSKAKELDEDSMHAHEALNEAFKATYEQINHTKGPSGPNSKVA